MNRFYGHGVCGGIAIGKPYEFIKNEKKVEKLQIEDIDKELQRFLTAKATAEKQLDVLFEENKVSLGEANALIFQIHKMLLEDVEFMESVKAIIECEKTNAEYAIMVTAERFKAMFKAMDDEYMQARAGDIEDISKRVIRILQGGAGNQNQLKEPAIIVAEDLSPSETVQLKKEYILGFALRAGSVNGHTAILARTMGIPAVVGLGQIMPSYDKEIIIDGDSSQVIIEADDTTISQYKKAQADKQLYKNSLEQYRDLNTITADGKRIKLYANIGDAEDVESVLKSGAEGIGLFRSEFLYLQGQDYPSEQEQYMAYKKVVEAMGDKAVIIRTLDIGADKQIDYFELPKEENPAMGYRAIRICLDREPMFMTQLRAIYRASAYGNVSIMFPMITSLWEVRRIKEIVEQVKAQLDKEGESYGKVELGIMIETPGAVMIAEELAKEVQFFSIGTNDLTQYTLALDRQNPGLQKYYDSHHPAILRMIRMTAEAAHKHNICVGICGELAADTALTKEFIEMGIDELSVVPSKVLEVRKAVRECK